MSRIIPWLKDNPFFAPFALLFLVGMAVLSQRNFLLFHSIGEAFSWLVSSLVFVIAWNARWRTGNHFMLTLGVGFICFAFVDFLHLLAYTDMGVFPGRGPDLPTQLWVVARIIEALAFLAAPMLLTRRIKPWILVLNAGAVTGIAVALIFLGHFPACFVPGQGLTDFKIGAEVVVCLLLALAALLLYAKRSLLDAGVFSLILWAIGLIIVQEVIFTLYTDVTGPFNVAGHLIKIVAAYLVYKAVLETGLREPQRVLFMELERGKRLLVAAEERYRSIADGAPVGIFRSTPQGRYEYANPRLAEIYGYDSPADLMATVTHIREQIYVDQERFHILRKRLAEADVVSGFQAEIRRKDGSTVWTSRDIRVQRDRAGRMVHFDGFVTDITDRKKLETLREDVERILRHDLKAPLISLTSGIAMIRALCRPDHRGELLLAEMDRSAMQMLGLIDLSMGLHKMEAGDYEIDPGPVDMIALLREVLCEHRMLMRAKKLEADIMLDDAPAAEDTELVVQGELALCRSLAANLVKNGLEASPEGASIHLELTSGPPLALTVRNQGEVPPEVREHFFEKYTTHGKPEGTGLGTYSVRLIAESHGWTVAMQTGDGATTVRVEFTAPD